MTELHHLTAKANGEYLDPDAMVEMPRADHKALHRLFQAVGLNHDPHLTTDDEAFQLRCARVAPFIATFLPKLDGPLRRAACRVLSQLFAAWGRDPEVNHG